MLFGPPAAHISVYIDQAHEYWDRPMALVIPLSEESHSMVDFARVERHT